MTAVSKNVYIDKLNDIAGKYNNIYHKTIKMKSNDVNSSTYINLDDHSRISKYKNSRLQSKQYIISGLSDEETVEMFYEIKFQKIPKNNIKQSLELKR